METTMSETPEETLKFSLKIAYKRIEKLQEALTQMSDAHRATASDLGEAKARIAELEAALEKR